MGKLPLDRDHLLVGRATELGVIDEISRRREVTFVTGPLGIGKTALLIAYQGRCAARGVPVVWIDPQLDVQVRADLIEAGARLPTTGAVLVLDDLHLLASLERWIVLRWLSTLPDTVVVVIASEIAPSPLWLEAGAPRMQRLELGPLSTEDAHAAIERRGLTGTRAAAVHELARGNPLLLVLASDIARRSSSEVTVAHLGKDVLDRLVPLLCRQCDSDGKRTALAALMICRTLGRELLDAVLDPGDDRQAVWAWLGNSAVAEMVVDGLRVHPSVRRPCLDWLRANQPSLFPSLHRKISWFYNQRLMDSPDPSPWVLDRIFLDRELPALQLCLRWNGDDPCARVERLDARDLEVIGTMVESREGVEARADVARWLTARPDEVDVMRRPTGEVSGLLLALRFMDRLPSREEREDPAVAVAASYVEKVAVPGASLLVFRSWMTRALPQASVPETTTLITQMTRRLLLTPSLHFHFSVTRAPERWLPLMSLLGFDHEIAGTFSRGGVTHTVVANDWRRQTIAEFLARSSETVLAALYKRGRVAPPAPTASVDVIDRPTPELSELLWSRVEQIATRMRMSVREREVLDLLLLGRTSAEIGTALGITERTARFHQANVLDKLGAETRLDILRILL